MKLVKTCPGLWAEKVNGSDLSRVVIRELGVRVATSKHHISQGMPTRLDGGQVLELAMRVRDGAQKVEVWTQIYPANTDCNKMRL